MLLTPHVPPQRHRLLRGHRDVAGGLVVDDEQDPRYSLPGNTDPSGPFVLSVLFRSALASERKTHGEQRHGGGRKPRAEGSGCDREVWVTVTEVLTTMDRRDPLAVLSQQCWACGQTPMAASRGPQPHVQEGDQNWGSGRRPTPVSQWVLGGKGTPDSWGLFTCPAVA